MMLTYGVFALYVCLTMAGAGAAVLSKSLVRAMFGLIASLFGVGGLYLLMQSPFLAFMQLLIYVGAVSVLVFFALMLTRAQADGDESEPAPRKKILLAFTAGLLPILIMIPLVVANPESLMLAPAEVPIQEIGKVLLGDYVLPFELISFILLVAMIGGVVLAWERRKR